MDCGIYNKIKAFCDKKHLIQADDGIVAGVSGGADSVFLLKFLLELKNDMGIRICIVHVNHGIRGEAARCDEDMVESLAKENGVGYRCFHADIPSMAGEKKCSEEEMGRLFRYECFEKVRCELGYSKIAVAHHMDDQAETVLFQLARGSASRGLCGMMPQNGFIIRPLLVVGRGEIEAELSRLGITYSQDLTNFEETYSRNRIRHNVLPYFEENIQPGTVRHIARTAGYMQEIRSYIEGEAQKLFDCIVSCENGRAEVLVESLRAEDIVLRRECLFMMMERVCGKRKDLSAKHMDELICLLNGNTGKRLSLPYGMTAGKDYGTLWIESSYREISAKRSVGTDGGAGGDLLEINCENGGFVLGGDDFHKITWERKREFNFETVDINDIKEKNGCTKWFDYGKIKNALVFRKPKQGDYLWISPDGGKKRLNRLFIDRKVPVNDRNRLWVLADGDHILWVPCLNRGSAYYYVGEGTVEALLINEEGKYT